MSSIKKIRMKNFNGVDYDIFHPETESSVITDKGMANGVASLDANGLVCRDELQLQDTEVFYLKIISKV